MIREKTNENITTAWNAILQKYENTKTERTIRMIEKFLTSKFKPSESISNYLRRQISKIKIAIKNVDSIDDFALLLLISKLNNEFPKKYKSIENYLNDNLEKVTIDDLEKRILDLEKADESRSLSEKSKSSESSVSNEGLESSKSTISKYSTNSIESEIKDTKPTAKLDDRIPTISNKLDSIGQTTITSPQTSFSPRSLNAKKSLELINLIKPKLPKIVDQKMDVQPIKSEESLPFETFATSTFVTSDESFDAKPMQGKSLLEKKFKTGKIDSTYDSKSLRLSSMESQPYKPGDFANQPKISKSLFKTISSYFPASKKQFFDIKNPNLNLGVKENEFAKLNLANTASPPTSISISLSSENSQMSNDLIQNKVKTDPINQKDDQKDAQKDGQKNDDHKDVSKNFNAFKINKSINKNFISLKQN